MHLSSQSLRHDNFLYFFFFFFISIDNFCFCFSGKSPLPLVGLTRSPGSTDVASAAGAVLPSRLLPVEWQCACDPQHVCLHKHHHCLEKHVKFIKDNLTAFKERVKNNEFYYHKQRCFRSSKLKKTDELQGVSMNLHVQVFGVTTPVVASRFQALFL